MNLLQFLLILKARYRIILATFAVTVAAAVLVVLLLPKSYTATTTLLLNYKGMDPVTGMVLPAQLMPGYMATQSDIIRSRNVALKVVDQLHLADSPAAQAQFRKGTNGQGEIRNWLAEMLLGKLAVRPSKESSVIEIAFTSPDPVFAADVVNAFAENYQLTSVQLKIAPAQQAAGYLGEQVQVLRKQLETAQSRLSAYQQEHGITNPEQSLDVENMRLNELSSQLSAMQANAVDAQSRLTAARRNAAESADVALNPTVQNLRIEASRAEVKLGELAQRLDRNHPQYQAAQAELDKINHQLQIEVARAASSLGSNSAMSHQRESELKAMVASQKQRVLALNRVRDEMAVLQKDVETARRAMDTVTQRYSQTSIEGQSNQNDIAILNPALPPAHPSSPRVLVSLALAVVMGTILGMGFGLLAEWLDRRVRSRDDVAEWLGVPVFAVVHGRHARGRQQTLLGRLQQALPLSGN